MTRRPLAVLWLAAGCTVGTPLVGDIADAPDGIQAMGPDASNGCITPDNPTTMHTHTTPVNAANPSNAGEPCVQSGCHLQGATGTNAPVWEFAGTVYHADGTTPYAGVVIKIVASDGATFVHTTTDTGGNFDFGAGALANPFPGHSFVTKCPEAPTSMTDPLPAVAATGGADGSNCNGCHVAAPVAGSPQTTRITLSP